MSGEKSDLKVVKDKTTDEIGVMDPETGVVQTEEKPKKKLTKAQQKKLEKEREAQIKKQAEEQAKAMDEQITKMGEAVKNSICNTCKHCLNPGKSFDRFKVSSSRGKELYAPMNFCSLAGLSLVDVTECEKHEPNKS